MKTETKIKRIIKKNRLVIDRIKKIHALGIMTSIEDMGSGGVGQTRIMSDGSKRIQISAAWGKYNYAHVAII